MHLFISAQFSSNIKETHKAMNLAEVVVCGYVFSFQELGSNENKNQQAMSI